MRKSTLLAMILGSLLLAGPGSVFAIAIDVLPQTQEVTAGTSVNIDIVISGHGDMLAPSVGAFDIDVAYNSSILSFNSLVFGDQLDVFGFGNVNAIDSSVSGVVNLFEISLDLASDLNTFQLPEFTLATLSFDSITAGVSALSLSLNALSDANGDSLMASVQGASVSVKESSIDVPEPATWLLLGAGLLGMLRFKRLQRSEWQRNAACC